MSQDLSREGLRCRPMKTFKLEIMPAVRQASSFELENAPTRSYASGDLRGVPDAGAIFRRKIASASKSICNSIKSTCIASPRPHAKNFVCDTAGLPGALPAALLRDPPSPWLVFAEVAVCQIGELCAIEAEIRGRPPRCAARFGGSAADRLWTPCTPGSRPSWGGSRASRLSPRRFAVPCATGPGLCYSSTTVGSSWTTNSIERAIQSSRAWIVERANGLWWSALWRPRN
jgi:hypothetical protein